MVSSNIRRRDNGRIRSKQVSAIALLTCMASMPATAQEINDARTAPVVSTTEIGAGAGTLTMTADGSIDVSNGTALTINGPHNFTMAATSSITNDNLLAGRGILVDASSQQILSDLEIGGDISVGNSDADAFDVSTATENVGLEISGDLGFEGDVTITSDGNIVVDGGDGRGILINGPMEGNITQSGDITVVGQRGVGMDLAGPITGDIVMDGTIAARQADTIGIHVRNNVEGAIIHRGAVTVGIGATSVDGDDTPAQAGEAGILIEGNVTGGILLDGIGNDNNTDLDGDGNDDITGDSTISSVGGAPGIWIRNADGTAPITIGAVDGETYGYIQRGNIVSSGESNENPAWGIRIEGAAGAPTTIEGGMYFDNGTVTTRAIDANAVGVEIGDYANVPTIVNTGVVDVDTFTSSTVINGDDSDPNNDVTVNGPGGDAVGILIQENGNLTSIDNSGSFLAAARGEGNTAVAIRDLSGTLTTIDNSGVIAGIVADTETSTAIAIDTAANTTGVTLNNSGTIVGDIRFGSGDDTASFTDGTVTGNIFFGTGADTLNISGDATFTGSADFSGTLDLNVDGADLVLGDTDVFHVTNADITNGGRLIFNVDLENDQAGSFEVDDTLTATADVNLQPIFTSFSDQTRTYDLITAGTIDFADADSSLALTDTPYLFDLNLEIQDAGTGSTVSLHVRPKTAEELEVSAAKTTLYDNMLNTGFVMDNQLEQSLAGLITKDDVEAAFAALLPDISNASFNSALLSERQFADHLSGRLIDFMQPGTFEGGAWVREVTNLGDHTASDSYLNSDILSVGLTLGYDQPVSDNIAVGVNGGFTLNGFSGTDETINSELSSFAPFLSVYSMARFGDLYLGLQATGQYVSLERERTIEFGIVERVVSSTTSGWNLAAQAEAGYELKLGGLRLKPYGRLSAQSYSESGYVEEGGDSANLDVGKRSFSRTQAGFGATLGYDFKWKRRRETKIFRPEVFYNYAKTISGSDPDALESIFVAGDTSFAMEIDQMSERVEQYGGSLNLFGDGSLARVNYAYEKLDDIKAHAISVNFGLTF